MTDWLQDYRESVSWGNDITYRKINETEYCLYVFDAQTYCNVPGNLTDISKALDNALLVNWITKAKTEILFLDKEATEGQIEEAIHRAFYVGIGCSFLEAEPKWIWYDLLDKYMEGTLFEEAMKAMEENNS